MLVEPLAAGDPAGSSASSSGLINAVRIGAAVPESSSSPSTPSSSGAGASSSSTPLASAGTKRKLLMHNDLRAVLAVDDYHALDAALYDHHDLVNIFICFMDSMARNACLRTLRDHPFAMLPTLAGGHDLS